jgi:hypothetical protein
VVWAFGVWLEVGEVGVDHVKERERGSTSTLRKGERQNGGKKKSIGGNQNKNKHYKIN